MTGHNIATVVGMDTRGSGHWLSSNEKIVHVNRVTGEAQARSEGVAEGCLKNMCPSKLYNVLSTRFHFFVDDTFHFLFSKQ